MLLSQQGRSLANRLVRGSGSGNGMWRGGKLLTTAMSLQARATDKDTGVLAREFIHDSLYNKMVGYFERNVNILKPNPGDDIKFDKFKDQQEYQTAVRQLYNKQIFERNDDMKGDDIPGKGQTDNAAAVDRDLYQLWHTPSTVFRPYYGRAVAQCILKNWDEQSPIVIYEVGPGNGSLCEDMMQFFQDVVPQAMGKLEYNFIEISQFQVSNILSKIKQQYPDNIMIHNMSFLEWNKVERRKAYVVAMEVFDNLPHDVVRFAKQDDGETLVQQGMVAAGNRTDGSTQKNHLMKQQEYHEYFAPLSDPIIAELVECMNAAGHKWYTQKGKSSAWDFALNIWPLSLFQVSSNKEFIPTDAFRFLKTLVQFFPNHYFIMSDFDYLPPTVNGFNGPVVQTRYKGKTVGSSSYLLQKGLCDIFFSTDFNLMASLYQHICRNRHKIGNSANAPAGVNEEVKSGGDEIIGAVVLKHRDFCLTYADHEATKTSSGYNPILDDFSNVAFLIAEHAPTAQPPHQQRTGENDVK